MIPGASDVVVQAGTQIRDTMVHVRAMRKGRKPPQDASLAKLYVADFVSLASLVNRETQKELPGYLPSLMSTRGVDLLMASDSPKRQIEILDKFYPLQAAVFGRLLAGTPLGEDLLDLSRDYLSQAGPSPEFKPRPPVDLSQGLVGPTGFGGC